VRLDGLLSDLVHLLLEAVDLLPESLPLFIRAGLLEHLLLHRDG